MEEERIEEIISETTEPPAETPTETHEEEPVTDDNSAEIMPNEQEPVQAAKLGERDREILDALDIMFNQHNTAPVRLSPEPPKEKKTAAQKLGRGVVQKGAGIVSLALILVFMGVVMLTCLFSGEPDYMLPLKLSPVAAVLLGIELLVHYLASGKNFRVHALSILFCGLIVAGSCIMAVSLDKSYRENRTEYNNRTIAGEIYESSYKDLKYVADIQQIDVAVDINPGSKSTEKGMEALSADDYVKISVVLDGSYSSPTEFAQECKRIIDGYRLLHIPVTDFSFVKDDRFNSFHLEIKGSFMQDYSVSELAGKVNYVYIEDYEYIDDLEDFVGDTLETECATTEE